MLELGFHRGTAVELLHLSSGQWQKRVGYLCVAAGSLSLGGFPFVPARARKSFQCWQHFQATLPTEPQAGFVCGVYVVSCTLHSIQAEAEEWLAVEIRLKGKSKALQPVSTECILLFHPAFSGSSGQGPVFLHSEARSLFLFEGQKGCKEITWLLKGWSGLSVYLQARGDKLFRGLHITWQLITSWRGEWCKCHRSSTGCC